MYESLAASLWNRVVKVKSSGCWEWQKGKDKDGYGLVVFQRKQYRTHRVAYELCYGSIPDGMFVCHHCDNPSCCNPAHLFLGTAADNAADMDSKGRRARGKATKRTDLDDADIIAIREMAAKGVRTGKIAKRFKMSGVNVFDIVTGKSWKHVGGPRTKLVLAGSKAGSAKLSDDQAIEIRQLASDGISHVEIAKRFPVGRSTITRIVNRKLWTHLT